jgi:hypothetical protein
VKVTREARKAITESIENLSGKTFTNEIGWELIELCAAAFAPNHTALVSWDGIHDGLIESVDGEWETNEVRLRVTDLWSVAAVVRPNFVKGDARVL